MTTKNLDGSAPDQSPLALMLIDTINDFEFPGGQQLLDVALPAAEAIAELKRRAAAASIPVIYANDNFGRWRSDFREAVRHCLEDGVTGEPVARLLQPGPRDYTVLKPRHSAFFETTLHLLLSHLGCQRLILTGFTGDMCVLFTAVDAYMRDISLTIPPDCVASIDSGSNRSALQYMEKTLCADLTPSDEIQLDSLLAAP